MHISMFGKLYNNTWKYTITKVAIFIMIANHLT